MSESLTSLALIAKRRGPESKTASAIKTLLKLHMSASVVNGGFIFSHMSTSATSGGIYFYDTATAAKTEIMTTPPNFQNFEIGGGNKLFAIEGWGSKASSPSSLYEIDGTVNPPVVRNISNSSENVAAAIYDANTNRILFTSTTNNSWDTLNLYMYDLNTATRSTVLNSKSGFAVGSFIWGPGGKSAILTYSDENNQSTGSLLVPL